MGKKIKMLNKRLKKGVYGFLKKIGPFSKNGYFCKNKPFLAQLIIFWACQMVYYLCYNNNNKN